MRYIVLLLGTLVLTHCAASPETIYLRTDGQDIASNPAFREQLDRDRIACLDDPDGNRDCMAVKGYVSVPKDQAAAKRQQIAAQNAEREAIAARPPPTPTRPHKTASAKKRKSTPGVTLRPSQD